MFKSLLILVVGLSLVVALDFGYYNHTTVHVNYIDDTDAKAYQDGKKRSQFIYDSENIYFNQVKYSTWTNKNGIWVVGGSQGILSEPRLQTSTSLAVPLETFIWN